MKNKNVIKVVEKIEEGMSKVIFQYSKPTDK